MKPPPSWWRQHGLHGDQHRGHRRQRRLLARRVLRQLLVQGGAAGRGAAAAGLRGLSRDGHAVARCRRPAPHAPPDRRAPGPLIGDAEGRWMFTLWLDLLAHASRNPEFRDIAADFWRQTRALVAQGVREVRGVTLRRSRSPARRSHWTWDWRFSTWWIPSRSRSRPTPRYSSCCSAASRSASRSQSAPFGTLKPWPPSTPGWRSKPPAWSSRSAPPARWTVGTWPCPAARCTASSAPTARARRPRSRCWPPC